MRLREERVEVLRRGIFREINAERERLAVMRRREIGERSGLGEREVEKMEREIQVKRERKRFEKERKERVLSAEREVEKMRTEMEREIKEQRMRLEDERKRLEKEIEKKSNAVEWRWKRLEHLKKMADERRKEAEAKELMVEGDKKAVEKRFSELKMWEEELHKMKRSVNDLCEEMKAEKESVTEIWEINGRLSEELELKRSQTSALQEEVKLLKKQIELRSKASCLPEKSRKVKGFEKSGLSMRGEQLSSIQNHLHAKEISHAQYERDEEAACVPTPDDVGRNEAEAPTNMNAVELNKAEWLSTCNPADVPCVDVMLSGKMDGRTLQVYLNDMLSKNVKLQDEIPAILSRMSDPAKIVLDTMEGFYSPHFGTAREESQTTVVRKTCICLLRNLRSMSPTFSASVRDEALKLAFGWKEKMTDENQLEVMGFIELVQTYGLANEFNGFELLNLSKMCSSQLAPPLKLLQDLGCIGSTTHYIKSLLRTNRRLQALKYISEAKLEDEFVVGPVVEAHLNYLKQTSYSILQEGGNTNAAQSSSTVDGSLLMPYRLCFSQMKAVDFEITGLKDLLKCIVENELQDQYSLASLKERIGQVSSQKHSRKRAAVSPRPKVSCVGRCNNVKRLKKESRLA
uniref:FRIGIDA-like protein n=1 Tax=Kalanchoe fedtschenkoi TaxID=63787 RepID=A0A7N0TFR8_KALFE